jgi:hypothetical protein
MKLQQHTHPKIPDNHQWASSFGGSLESTTGRIY